MRFLRSLRCVSAVVTAVVVNSAPSLAAGILPAKGEAVYSASLGDLKKIKQTLDDPDILGADYQSGDVQLRISPHEMTQLAAAGVALTSFSSDFTPQAAHTGYRTPAATRSAIQALARDYPDIIKVIEIGKSTDQQAILAAVVTAPGVDAASKPSLLFNGMHHARELMSGEVVFDILEHLAKSYTVDAEITAWLEQYQIVIVPQMNPDGNDRVHNGDSWWRKNTYTRNGYLLGVDLNRNYPTFWNSCEGSSGSAFSDAYRGPKAASEPETQALMRLVERFKPVFNISYHAYSEIIIYPYGCSNQKNSAADLFRNIAADMSRAIVDDRGESGTYTYGTAPELLYEADGSDLDFQWREHNVLAYTIEINSKRLGFHPDYNTWRQRTVINQRGGWKALLRRMAGSGIKANLDHDISYSVETDTSGGHFATWSQFANGQTSRSLRPGGVLYQPLNPGRYRLQLYRNGALLRSIPLSVGAQLLDLGLIEVDVGS